MLYFSITINVVGIYKANADVSKTLTIVKVHGPLLVKINIGIKHGFSCINIRQVPREVLKTEAGGRGFQHSLGTWRMLMHWKTMFDRYYCIKSENVCYISHYFLHYLVSPFHRCLANAISTGYARSRAGQYTSRNGSKSVAPVRLYWKLRSRA